MKNILHPRIRIDTYNEVKGYTGEKEFIRDYKAYLLTMQLNLYRREGTSIYEFLLKRITHRLKQTGPKFYHYLEAKGYTIMDLKYIAVNDCFRQFNHVSNFLGKMHDTDYDDVDSEPEIEAFEDLFCSKSFKEGRLKKVIKLLPNNLKDERDLIRYMKSHPALSENELYTVLSRLKDRDWIKTLNDLEAEGKVNLIHGAWYA